MIFYCPRKEVLRFNEKIELKYKRWMNLGTPIAGKYTLDLSLWLDDYDDIYSDFDSRNYLKRRVSTDFIDERRNSLKNKTEKINDLVLILPKDKRRTGSEQIIIQNLRNYFIHQFNFYNRKYKGILKKASFF